MDRSLAKTARRRTRAASDSLNKRNPERGVLAGYPARPELLFSTPDDPPLTPPSTSLPNRISLLPSVSWRQSSSESALHRYGKSESQVNRIERAERLAWQSAAPKNRGAALASPVTCLENWVNWALGNPTQQTPSPAALHNWTFRSNSIVAMADGSVNVPTAFCLVSISRLTGHQPSRAGGIVTDGSPPRRIPRRLRT